MTEALSIDNIIAIVGLLFGGGGIGVIRKEKNNALQWAEWGFDYLKYD